MYWGDLRAVPLLSVVDVDVLVGEAGDDGRTVDVVVVRV